MAAISPNLSLSVAHAISFLTRPLIPSYPETTIIKLWSVLKANLLALWAVREPFYNSTCRCITLSPDCLPPSVIYSACLAAGVQWFDWIPLLGGREFDLFIEPSHVFVRCGKRYTREEQFTTVWVDNPASAPAVEPLFHRTVQMPIRDKRQAKTFAQQLLEVDHEDDEQLFALIAGEVSSPRWIQTQPSASIRSSSPLSTISSRSRSSSRSSSSRSCFSLVSSGSATSMSTSSSPALSDKRSSREMIRQTRVFVDTSKTEITPYDGGKTTVLTGGVMLGGAPSTSKSKMAAMRPVNNSRFTRF